MSFKSTPASNAYKSLLRPHKSAVSLLELGESISPITVIANEKIIEGFDDNCLKQAVNARLAPGISGLVLNPDAHLGYGAPVGCVMTSPTHVYPGPVGVDIKCSMSLLQTDIDASEVVDPRVRRELIKAICQRIPTGAGRGSRDVPKSRRVDERLGFAAATEGASKNVLRKLGQIAAKILRTEHLTILSIHFSYDWRSCFARSFASSDSNLRNWVLLAVAIILENVKSFHCRKTRDCDALASRLGCTKARSLFYRIAAREDLAIHWLAISFQI
jgi:hypothetical protein